MPDFRSAAKAIRSSQPFNLLATFSARTILQAVGRESPFLVRHLPRVGRVHARLPNGSTLVLWSQGDDWVSNQVFWKGWRGYEPETIELFYRAASRAVTVIDVGAYVGFFSLVAAHANPEGRVFAFEPHPTTYERLERHVVLNHLSNVTCVRSAVGDREGSADLVHAPTGLPCSSSLSEGFMASHADTVRSTVPLLTLDGFLEDEAVGPVTVLKIDTESTEPEVLRGSQRMLERDHPLIFCEVLPGHGTARELEAILRPLDYRFYLLTSEGPRHVARIEGHTSWLNYLFAWAASDVSLI
jgi:FkbM family methyltransferase